MELVLVLRFLDQKVRVVVVVLEVVLRVDLAGLVYLVDFHCCRHLHCHPDHLLQVDLGRLVAACLEMLLFLFLYL